MTGEVWSKAVMLALLSIARLQNRDLAVIHFSGPDDLRVDRFPKGQATPAKVIACASFFFNGGMVFEPWMKKALELVDESRFEKADVICVSDGISDDSPEAQAECTWGRAGRGSDHTVSRSARIRARRFSMKSATRPFALMTCAAICRRLE
jgi:uncharacterized protein with von Willebrand factor type A (vWA) domain